MLTREPIRSICFEQIIPKWHCQPDTFPRFLPVVSPEEKASNEMRLFRLQKHLRDMPRHPSGEQREAIKARIKKEIRQFFAEENEKNAKALPLGCPPQDGRSQEGLWHKFEIECHDPHTRFAAAKETFPGESANPKTGLHTRPAAPKKALLHEFEKTIETFLDRANAFDETISTESLWQAMRNYLIYAVIANLQGKSQDCHDAILGYSLLYPYTDNYIDAWRRTSDDKNAYHDLIRRTLSGESASPRNDHEKKTMRLLYLVLDHYSDDVTRRQDAANLLLIMLQAQEESMLQIHRRGAKKLDAAEILRISAYKGGLSVLLDYMISIGFDCSERTEDEMCFYLALGLVLQLADDLQDLAEDRKKHAQTLATACRGRKARERFANRLLHFAWDCISGFSPRNPELHHFILRNCQSMLLVSVAQNAKYFSKDYLKMIDPYLPVSLSYIMRMGGDGMLNGKSVPGGKGVGKQRSAERQKYAGRR